MEIRCDRRDFIREAGKKTAVAVVLPVLSGLRSLELILSDTVPRTYKERKQAAIDAIAVGGWDIDIRSNDLKDGKDYLVYEGILLGLQLYKGQGITYFGNRNLRNTTPIINISTTSATSDGKQSPDFRNLHYVVMNQDKIEMVLYHQDVNNVATVPYVGTEEGEKYAYAIVAVHEFWHMLQAQLLLTGTGFPATLMTQDRVRGIEDFVGYHLLSPQEDVLNISPYLLRYSYDDTDLRISYGFDVRNPEVENGAVTAAMYFFQRQFLRENDKHHYQWIEHAMSAVADGTG